MAEQSEGLEQTEIIEDSQEVEQPEQVEGEESTQEEKKQTKSQNAKQRLRRKLREEAQARQQAEEANRQLMEKINAIEEKVNNVANPPPKRPSRVEYESDEEYEDALFEWRDSKLPRQEPQPKPTQPTEQPEELPEVDPEVLRNWQHQVDKASEKYDDFEDYLTSIPPQSMTEAMTLAIMENEEAGEVAYFLGKNHKEAARIANLNIAAQIREIDKLSQTLKPKQTSAPPPINPEKGGDSPVKDPEKMSPEEYRDWRRSQGMGY